MRTALLVPFPEAEPATTPWWPLWDPPKAVGIPAHVTVIFPFLRASELSGADLTTLREIASSVPAFDVSFARVGRFPATVWLAPEPAAPFVELTRLVAERFPGIEPYGGEHDEIVPHLTVLSSHDAELLERAAKEVVAALPLAARATELWLMAERSHGWTARAVLPLGAS